MAPSRAASAGSSRRRLKRVLIDNKIKENFESLEKEINNLEIACKEHENLNPAIPFSAGKIYVVYKNLVELLRVYE